MTLSAPISHPSSSLSTGNTSRHMTHHPCGLSHPRSCRHHLLLPFSPNHHSSLLISLISHNGILSIQNLPRHNRTPGPCKGIMSPPQSPSASAASLADHHPRSFHTLPTRPTLSILTALTPPHAPACPRLTPSLALTSGQLLAAAFAYPFRETIQRMLQLLNSSYSPSWWLTCTATDPPPTYI